MTGLKIYLLNSEVRETEYVFERLRKIIGGDFSVTTHKKYTVADVYGDSDDIGIEAAEVVASMILSFYKYEFLKSELYGEREPNPVEAAVLGALLSFDREEEFDRIKEAMNGLGEISAREFFDYRLLKLKECWEGLAALSKRLLYADGGEPDFYDFISFILAIDRELSPKVSLRTDNGVFRMFVDGTPTLIPALTGRKETDALISVVGARPRSIVISDAAVLPDEILGVIKKLGES